MKRTILYAILVPILFMALFLSLYSFRALENPVTPVEIPEGWEVVSSEKNCVHIRMKEGADSRVWIEHPHAGDFFVDVHLPGGEEHVSTPYDAEKTISVIVYYGYGKRSYNAERDSYSINPNLPPPKYTDYQLIMRTRKGDRYFTTLLFDLPGFANAANVEYTNENEVGYTHGIIVDIPLSDYQAVKNARLDFSLRAKGESHIDGNSSIYFTHNPKKSKMIVETAFDAWDDDHQYGFPQLLTEPRIMIVVVNGALLLSILIFTIFSLVRKKDYGLPYVYVALALLLNFVMTIWLDKETSGYLVLDFSWAVFFIAQWIYLFLAGILGIVQLIVTWIQKCIAKRKANKLSSVQSDPGETRPLSDTTDLQ